MVRQKLADHVLIVERARRGISEAWLVQARTDEQMKARGHQDRACENNVRPTKHHEGCLDESPLPRGVPRNGQHQKRGKSTAHTGYQYCRVRGSESYPRLWCGAM